MISDRRISGTLLGKIKGGLVHWLIFVGEPAISPTNNGAKHALREPVIPRKIIGTLRNDQGIFSQGTLGSLWATWRQRGRNPYKEFKRVIGDNEVIPREQTVPMIEASGYTRTNGSAGFCGW